MNRIIIEIIGISATLLILISMAFKTDTYKSTLLMRFFNLIGSIIFVIYGCMLPSISTAALNAALIIVNARHMFLLKKENDNKKF